MKQDVIRTTLIDPVTAVRVRSAMNQALRAGTSPGEARSEGRGYLRALRPDLPRQQVGLAVDVLLAELGSWRGAPLRMPAPGRLPGRAAPPAAGQLSLGF
jgi:hypothetical protein